MLFYDTVSIKSLTVAWQKFSRAKKSRRDVADYQKELKWNIRSLAMKLQMGAYTHGKYCPFVVHDPKRRQIHKASVEDRIVHQAIVSAIEPLFEPRFVFDSYSCRVGKGTHAGVKRVRDFLLKEGRNHTRNVYALKCDVRKYFDSIDHEILMQLIEKQCHDEPLLEFIRTIILSYSPETGKGIPLGNVTSQLFANIYLNQLDFFMKHTLRAKNYARYCDDSIVVSHDKVYLESLIEPIREFLKINLALDLHPRKVSIDKWNRGIDFLGYVMKPRATLIRTKTKRRMLRRVTVDNQSSYQGLCAHADTYELSQLMSNVTWERSTYY